MFLIQILVPISHIWRAGGGTQRPRQPRGVQGGTQRSKGSPGGSPREEMLETNSFSN